MQNAIQASQSLGNIEKSIIAELNGKELWGDITVTAEEYGNLKARIKTLLEMGSVDIRYICDHYPCSMTTFMVFLVRYEFNVNFWGLMSQELGIRITSPLESEIGQCARMTFDKYGFDYSDVKKERRVNLEPILYEAGRPPESSLDDLFYVLTYDAYSVFDPQLVIEDLVEMRSYHIRKPMLRFLKRFRDDRAMEFVLEVHDAMLAVDQNRTGESHYIGNYAEWKDKEKTKAGAATRKKQEFQAKPYLIFENGKRGLCLMLPRTIMKNEWVDDVEWVITAGNAEPVHKRMTVFGDEGKRYVESMVVPVSPASSYQVILYECEGIETDKIVDWSVDGIRNGEAVFFNANGRMITPSYLPVPYGIMVCHSSSRIVGQKHVTVSQQSYPTNREGYSVLFIEPNGRDASIEYLSNESAVVLRTRPQIDMSFSGKTLFSLPVNGEYRLFTELPELSICVDEGALTNGYMLKIGHDMIDISKQFQDGTSVVRLKKYKQSAYSEYGTYSIRLYQYDHFLKQVEFSYVPKIKTNYSPDLSWTEQHDRNACKEFRFERLQNWELEFQNCVVKSDEAKYIVECPANKGSITCSLKSIAEDEGFFCSFELPVNPFEINILDSQGMIKDEATDKVMRLGLSDLNNSQYWLGFECFGIYREFQYTLKLRSSNGIEQEEVFPVSKNGCGNFNLGAFYDTLNACPLPAQIELWCEDDGEKTVTVLVISDTLELFNRPYYAKGGFVVLGLKDENKDLTIRRFGKERFEVKLPYEKSVLGNSKTARGYPCSEKLENGIYVVEGESKRFDFVFEDDFGVEISNGKNTMYVSSRAKDAPINSFSDWLDQLIKDILAAGINKDIVGGKSWKLLDSLDKLERNDLDRFDYERLASLAYFVESKCVDAKRTSIRKCMNVVSGSVLNGKSRLELIRLLADLNCPQAVFDICLQEYNLLLFERGSEDSKELAEKLENKSIELSMLLLMGIEESVWNTIRRDKYRDLIGKEAIRCMLSVPDEDDPAVITMEQKKFLREYSPCKVRINLTKEISGDMEPLAAMLEITRNSVVFNIDKKPDYGVYFDRIRYVDQYVNWYTANHDKKGEMVPWKSELMKSMVQVNCASILKCFQELGKVGFFGQMMTNYNKVLRERFKRDPFANMSVNDYQRYFYLQGLAAFLVMLPPEYRKYGWPVRVGEQFMVEAARVAPRIARRDLVMAAVYIYLIRKEEKICR